ncbi:virulence factor MVIN family protein [Pelistega indica]|uniref:Virulence factor MVIN family protein n=1 Tax=Pelistega indica TaxID=1414851 RepID=V8G8I0_9BURK|nr:MULTISPECIES: lipid II flippase MurJ [Pelistega]ETD72263.1 virulence factor MVIN family protein [Pelistega indica]
MRIISGAMRVAFFLIVGKLAGAIKEMALANRYGVSDVVDAYQFTQSMANWLPLTIVGAFSIVLIPVLVKLKHLDKQERYRFIAELQAWVLTIGVVSTVVIWLAWPIILEHMAGKLSVHAKAFSEQMIWVFAPVGLLILFIGLSTARLRSHERHINNLLDSLPALFIFAWVMLSPGDVSVWPIALGTLAGYLLQTVLLQYMANKLDDERVVIPSWRFTSNQWSSLMSAAGLMLVGQIALSFVQPLDQMYAAHIGNNANATMGYATRLISVVIGIGAASVGRAALPVLADVQHRGNPLQARNIALKWALAMVGLGVIALFIAWFIAPYMVKIVFERGAFTAENTEAVAQVLRFGLLQVPFYFGVLILVQLLASQNRYRWMAIIALTNFAVKFLMNYLLVPIYGIEGIMLATASMYLCSFLCYFLMAWRSPIKYDTE